MSEIQKWTVTEPCSDVQGRLLEGPYYDESRNQLRFVDIWHEKLHIVDLEKGPRSVKTLDTGTPIGVTQNFESTELVSGGESQIVVGAKLGYGTLDLETGKVEYIRKIWSEADGPGIEERMRFNDGAVDSRGRFWGGAMTDMKVAEVKNEGVLFRLDSDLSLHRMVENMEISNGLAWNADDTVMYVTDSPTKNIYAYDFDVETGNISNRRIFFTVPDESFPDGFAMDEEGCFWIALYGGSRVIKVSPQGKIVGEVYLPTKCITCTEFVGTDLYITTAQDDNNPEDPYGGRLYKVNVGVRGKPRNKFKLATSL